MPKKKSKKRLRVKFLLKVLVILVVVIASYLYLTTIKIKNIYIIGTTTTKDIDIIEISGIKDYPAIYKLNLKTMAEEIKTLPLVDDVTIKRNIFGKLTITITESKILFFYKYNNKYITSSGNAIENSDDYYGYPTLINFTPDTVFEKFIAGLNKIDYNIISMINEIEYTPYKSSDGTVIDENRFTLKMNDSNTVMIDTVNIKNLNKYPTIYASLDMDTNKGTLYLDTIVKDTISFRSYETNVEEEKTIASESSE